MSSVPCNEGVKIMGFAWDPSHPLEVKGTKCFLIFIHITWDKAGEGPTIGVAKKYLRGWKPPKKEASVGVPVSSVVKGVPGAP